MKWKANWSFIALLLTATILIFWRINDRYVAFTDELLFEEASYRVAFGSDDLKMSRVNEVLIPINEGKVWLEKAPLYFWMTAPVYKLSNIKYQISKIWCLRRIYKNEVQCEEWANQWKFTRPVNERMIRDGEFVYPWIRRWWTDVAGVMVVVFVYKISGLLFKYNFRHKNSIKVSPLKTNPASSGILKQVQDDSEYDRWGNTVGLLAGFLLLASPLFLATTKSASLDMMATMWMTGAIYFYLKSRSSVVNRTISLNLNKSNETPPNLPLLRGGIKRPPWLRGGITQWKYPILCGMFIGLGLMTRSFLALTPIGLIVIDILLNSVHLGGVIPISINKGITPPRRDSALLLKRLGLIILVALLVALPWHLYMLYLFKAEFLRTYLGFNVIQHAVELTPGYEATKWWFYLPNLIKQIPWLVPTLIGSGLFILYGGIKNNTKLLLSNPTPRESKPPEPRWVRGTATLGVREESQSKNLNTMMDSREGQLRKKDKTDNKHIAGLMGILKPQYHSIRGRRVQDDNLSRVILFLSVWLFLPLIVLSLSTTRHEWYLVQIMPPLVILMALLIIKAYEVIKSCNQCQMTKYLAEILFLTFTLSGIISVLITPEPSTPTVKALRWARENTPIVEPIYVYKQWFLPQTLLFQPKKVALVDHQQLSKLLTGNDEACLHKTRLTQSQGDPIATLQDDGKCGGLVYLFVADLHEDEVRGNYPELKVEEEFKMGKIYSNR